MSEINKLRAEIDQIHGELASLLRRRLLLTKKIWQIKKSEALPLVDLQREEQILNQFDSQILDSTEKSTIQNIFKNILSESRKYLEAHFK